MRRLTLNRPERLNTMTAELCDALHAALDEIGLDRSCRAVVLTGAGRGFCAGLDLARLRARARQHRQDESRDRLANQQHMSRLVLALRALPQPVIAAVNGPSAGFGLALALGCDIRFAADGGRVPRRVRQHRRLQLRHGHELAAAAADRRLALARADAHRRAASTPRRRCASGSSPTWFRGRRSRRALEAAGQIAGLAPWGVRLTKQGMWTALEIPSEQAAVEYEDRQQIMATFGRADRRRSRRSSRSARRSSRTRRDERPLRRLRQDRPRDRRLARASG